MRVMAEAAVKGQPTPSPKPHLISHPLYTLASSSIPFHSHQIWHTPLLLRRRSQELAAAPMRTALPLQLRNHHFQRKTSEERSTSHTSKISWTTSAQIAKATIADS